MLKKILHFLLLTTLMALPLIADAPAGAPLPPAPTEAVPAVPLEGPSYGQAVVKMLLTLLLLIALIFFTVWMLRRFFQNRLKSVNDQRSIKIIERRPLSAKTVLYLIESEGKRVLISESQLEVRPLTGEDLMPLNDE